MYKILDTDSNTHVIFDSYTDACAFKGLDPKKAYKVKRNTKDRPKHFNSVTLINFAVENNIKAYVRDWLILNNLRA
jgi:hypothetical protein